MTWEDQVKAAAYSLAGQRLQALAPGSATDGVITASGQRVTAGQTAPSTVAGIPTMYLVAGIAAIALAYVVWRKKG